MLSKRFIVCIFFLAQLSCKEKYDPPVEEASTGYLVVEANIATGGDWTIARLTRTVPVYDTTKIVSEIGAQVWVEGEDNSMQQLSNRGDGFYKDSGLNVLAGNKYRLRIKIGSKDYLSDYVIAKISPPIDSVGWGRDNTGVGINVSTHDDSRQTQFYRWEYEEVWETRSRYFSNYISSFGVLRKRIFPEEDVYTCWKYNNSSNFLLANSTVFSEDKIDQRQIIFIQNGDDRLSVKYTVLVKQYALDQGAFDFFQTMKKNTDDIGSIFSPQPSEIRGNVHCMSDPSEYVLGYVTASSVTTKRIFINAADVPDWGDPFECSSVELKDDVPGQIDAYVNSSGLVVYNIVMAIPVSTYYFTDIKCADCIANGGTKNKPPFW